jgi:hypothetical protein
MVRLEGYSSLSKKQEDLLKLGFSYDRQALVTVTSDAPDLRFKARAAHLKPSATTPVLASTSVHFKKDLLTFTAKRRSDSLSHFIFEYTPKDLIPNLKFKSEARITHSASGDRVEPSATVDYSHTLGKAKLTVSDNPGVAKASVTFGKPEYGVGLDGKFEFGLGRFTGYNVAGWWFRKHAKLVVKHVGTDKSNYAVGDCVMSYYQKLTPLTHLASLVKVNWPTKNTYIEVGGDYKYDDKTLLKAKTNSDGKVGLAFIHKLSSNLKVTLATEVDSKKVTSASVTDYAFGFRLDFNHTKL